MEFELLIWMLDCEVVILVFNLLMFWVNDFEYLGLVFECV